MSFFDVKRIYLPNTKSQSLNLESLIQKDTLTFLPIAFRAKISINPLSFYGSKEMRSRRWVGDTIHSLLLSSATI